MLISDKRDALVADLGTTRQYVPRPFKGEDEDWLYVPSQDTTDLDGLDEQKVNASRAVQFRASVSRMSQHQIGTPQFMAPELQSLDYSYPVDVWAYGVLITELFSAQPAYDLDFGIEVLTLVQGQKLKPNELSIGAVKYQEIADLVGRCLEFDPKDRPSFREIEEIFVAVYHKATLNKPFLEDSCITEHAMI